MCVGLGNYFHRKKTEYKQSYKALCHINFFKLDCIANMNTEVQLQVWKNVKMSVTIQYLYTQT